MSMITVENSSLIQQIFNSTNPNAFIARMNADDNSSSTDPIGNSRKRTRSAYLPSDDDSDGHTSISTDFLFTFDTSGTTSTSTHLPQYLEVPIGEFIKSKVKEYSSILSTISKLEIAKIKYEKHVSESSFPKDIDIKLKSSNPYPKSLPNVSDLMSRELEIIHAAKLEILTHRLEQYKSNITTLTNDLKTKFSPDLLKVEFNKYPSPNPDDFFNEQLTNLYESMSKAKTTYQRNFSKQIDKLNKKKAKNSSNIPNGSEATNEMEFETAVDRRVDEKLSNLEKKLSKSIADLKKDISKNTKTVPPSRNTSDPSKSPSQPSNSTTSKDNRRSYANAVKFNLPEDQTSSNLKHNNDRKPNQRYPNNNYRNNHRSNDSFNNRNNNVGYNHGSNHRYDSDRDRLNNSNRSHNNYRRRYDNNINYNHGSRNFPNARLNPDRGRGKSAQT